MKIIIPNLKRRPDKRAAMEIYLSTYSHTFRFIESHDAEDYSDIEHLLEAMQDGGWQLEGLNKLNIAELCGEKDRAYIPIRRMPHLAFRWTYLDILKDIVRDGVPTLILIDDMYLPYTPADYDVLIERFMSCEGHLLALDPIKESSQVLVEGYHAPTEEAVYWKREGAAAAIPLFLTSPEKVMGDILRHRYPKDKMFTTGRLMAKSIGDKRDWNSDIHINSESQFR